MQTQQTKWMKTIAAKSDQINADDLIAGDKIIEITGVKVDETSEQPATLFYKGDNGKPFKPCKTVRKIIAHCWGGDENLYVGRSMLLYRDASVKWAGEEVGGIRIKAMSHIDSRKRLSLQIAKGRRMPITIDVLASTSPQFDWPNALAAIEAAADEDSLKAAYTAAYRYAKSINDPAKMTEAANLKDEVKERLNPTDKFPEFDEVGLN